jgi:hypothetical protein
MLRRVVSKKLTDVLEVLTASIIRTINDWGSKHLWNFVRSKNLKSYVV